MKNLFLLGISSAFVILAAGCSKSPESYNTPAPPAPPAPFDSGKAVPTDKDLQKAEFVEVGGVKKTALEVITEPISDVATEGSFAFDAKVQEGARRPMFYKVGAGGITFDTTLTESEEILVKPEYGPTATGDSVYREGLRIIWRNEEPRNPSLIVVWPTYLGEMALPAPHTALKMGAELASKGTEFNHAGYETNKKGAEQLSVDYYNLFEGKDSSYNCIREQTCKVDWGDVSQKYFLFEIPGKMIWNVSKDRFVLFIVVLIDPKPAISLPLDLATGAFVVSETEQLTLGQDFQTVEDQLASLLDIDGSDIKTSVFSDSFARQYDGTQLSFLKTVFDRKSLQPLPTDTFMSSIVGDGYPEVLVLGNKGIMVAETPNDVDLRLVPMADLANAQNTVSLREIPLSIRLGLQKTNVKTFVEKMRLFLEKEIKTTHTSSTVGSRFIGAFDDKKVNQYMGQVVSYDPVQEKGYYIQFGAEEENGNMTSAAILALGKSLNSADTLIWKNFTTPIEKAVGPMPLISLVDGSELKDEQGVLLVKEDKLPHFTQLSGFTIGDQVEVRDWDLGRQEATVRVTSAASGLLNDMRTRYVERGVVFVSYDVEKDMPQSASLVSVGTLGVSLGLNLISETADVRTYKVLSITSSLNMSSVKDICGQTQWEPVFGMSSRQFLTEVAKLQNCEYLPKTDSGDSGRLVEVYFPQDRIRLNFDQQELVSATIYAPNSEVK